MFIVGSQPFIEYFWIHQFKSVHLAINIDFVFFEELYDRSDDIFFHIEAVVIHVLRKVVAFDSTSTVDQQFFRLLERNQLVTFPMNHQYRHSDIPHFVYISKTIRNTPS